MHTCEFVELEDGVFEGGNVSKGGRDGAKDCVVGNVKVAQLLCVADGRRNHTRELIIVRCQNLRADIRIRI